MGHSDVLAARVVITEQVEGVAVEVSANFPMEDEEFKDTMARKLVYIAYKAVQEELDKQKDRYGKTYVTGDPRSLKEIGEDSPRPPERLSLDDWL